jgi:hypothetical protein
LYPQRRRCPLGNRINVFSVPRDRVERACRPLRDSHHSTWLMMGALLATARHPVSHRSETRCRHQRRRSSSRHRGQPKQLGRSGIMIRRAEYPRSLRAIVGAISACLAKCAQIADSEVARFGQLGRTRPLEAQQPKIPQKKQRPPGRIKLLQEGIDHPGRSLRRRTGLSAVLCSAPKMQGRAL